MTNWTEDILPFLGNWRLLPQTCDYEQGHPPKSGSYGIALQNGEVSFTISAVDLENKKSKYELKGKADGEKRDFVVKDVIDTLSIELRNDNKEIWIIGFSGEREQMVSQLQLDSSNQALRVTQVVFFTDGSKMTNSAVYSKRVVN